MRVVLAAGAGSVVDGRGPGAGVPGAVSEVADGVAELAADRPPEGAGDMRAGLAGDRADPGQPGEGLRVGETGPAVSDLGQQPGGAQCPGTGQGREDVRVGVGGQLDADPVLQGLDLGGEHGHRRGQGNGDACLGGPVLPGHSARRGPQPRAQHADRGRAAPHRDGLQPGSECLLIELAGGVLAAEAGQERQADRAAQIAEQADRGGKRHSQVGMQLVACGPVPRPQVLHLPGGDHHHDQARGQQRLDKHAVAPLDRDLADTAPAQPRDQRIDPRLVMNGTEPVCHPAGHVNHARHVISGGPVNAGEHLTGRDIRQNLD